VSLSQGFILIARWGVARELWAMRSSQIFVDWTAWQKRGVCS
jgi:hypothetical protein